MSALAPNEIDRLAKLLGMLGSDHAGERDAAATAAHRLVQQRNVTWFDVLRPAPVIYEPPRATRAKSRPPEWLDDVFLAQRHAQYCSQWEQVFVNSIAVVTRLSLKQRQILTEIADKLRERGLA